MTRRIASTLALLLLLAPASAHAQIRQVSSSSSSADGQNTINFTVGYFALKGLESRGSEDVIAADLLNQHPLLFQVKDLNSAVIGGEYLVAAGRNIEFGVGLGFSQRTVPSVYADFTHSNGDEIVQDIKLRQIPVTLTGRVLLLPRGSAVEPYIGGGVVAIRYQYSETGEFVDEVGTIFPANYIVKGTAAGPTVLAGVRVPLDQLTVGGEVRWQKVEGKGLFDQGFLTDKLDLGGWHANFTLGFRF
jgi:opacity protein-like surface antigen